MTTLFYIDRETWGFINSFAPWLSAIGTLAAVITSLYLALADRSRLRVRAWLYETEIEVHTVPIPGDDGERRVVAIRATNPRDKAVFAEEIYWKVGGEIIPQSWSLSEAGPEITAPSMLIGGTPMQLVFELGIFQTYYLPRLATPLSRSSKRVKIGVRSSTGKRFESKIEKQLEDWLRETAT
jgi:hypothetical protein